VTEVSVNLKIDGSWNGDLYAKLERGAETAVLLNGVGRNGSAPGYDDDGVDVFLTDASPSQGDIHTYQNVTGPLPVGVPLTGAWQSDGRNGNRTDAMLESASLRTLPRGPTGSTSSTTSRPMATGL